MHQNPESHVMVTHVTKSYCNSQDFEDVKDNQNFKDFRDFH